MTPGEAVAVVRSIAKDRERQMQLAVVAGWHSEAFARQKRLPNLKSILRGKPKQPTEAEKAVKRAEMDDMMSRMPPGVEILR